MKLKILTPEAIILDQEVESITLPGLLGEMTILPTHAAMVALLKKGRFHYKTANGKESSWFQIDGGFVYDKILANSGRKSRTPLITNCVAITVRINPIIRVITQTPVTLRISKSFLQLIKIK